MSILVALSVIMLERCDDKRLALLLHLFDLFNRLVVDTKMTNECLAQARTSGKKTLDTRKLAHPLTWRTRRSKHNNMLLIAIKHGLHERYQMYDATIP
ncbi:hypothetical protein [Brevibacillus porteri]|uniref:hypothetical protein n=1 Tax=Brevibacillus porteri TaxID=2126350 RepID=UPI003D226010